MKFFQQILTVVFALMAFTASAGASGGSFPDGMDIPVWFNDTSRIDIDTLGRKYVITSYGVKNDSTLLQTEAIQRVIDLAAAEGGGSDSSARRHVSQWFAVFQAGHSFAYLPWRSD